MKDTRSVSDLEAKVQKREKIKVAGNQENVKEIENEKDQKVLLHHPVEVAAVAQVTRRRTKKVNERRSLAAEALRRNEKRGLAVGIETKIETKIGNGVQRVAISQILQDQGQRVEVLIEIKENPRAVETREGEMMMRAQTEARIARSPKSPRRMLQVQVWM